MPEENHDLSPLGKRLFLASSSFTKESRFRSWWYVISTFIVLAAVLLCAAYLPWWPLRLCASVVGGLVIVRGFVLYHDFAHGSLLHGSRLAKGWFYLFGSLLLAPPRYWRFSHNFHHAHVGQPTEVDARNIPVLVSDIGTFPLMTTESWRAASFWQRFGYRVTRHPLTILFANFTIFFLSLCLIPLLHNPRKYWDGGLSILAHFSLIAVLWIYAGFSVAFFAFILPYGLAAAVGAYLFYAQHNFAGARIVPESEWTYHEGSLHSSSYMKLGPIMRWFTANIGYHHIHHLNPQIPFYRLPEAVAAIPELQNPPLTTLHPRDIVACMRSNLWDPEKQRLVSFREAVAQGDPK